MNIGPIEVSAGQTWSDDMEIAASVQVEGVDGQLVLREDTVTYDDTRRYTYHSAIGRKVSALVTDLSFAHLTFPA